MAKASLGCCGCFEGLRRSRAGGRAGAESVGSARALVQAWASPVPHNGAAPGVTGLDAAAGPEFQRCVSLDVDSELRRTDVLAKLRPETRSKFEVEQLVAAPGSLPKPLSPQARKEAIRTLLPSVTHQNRSKLPAELLEAQDMEGQALRRRLVHGSTVVFLTAGYAGKRFVFERACRLGIKSVVIEHPGSWAEGLVSEGLIAKFIPVDMSRASDEIFRDSLELIRGLGQDGATGPADAVCTLVELSVPLVARLCEKLGLPGPAPGAVDAARDKHATRAALKAAGLPTPRNCLIHSEEEALQAARHVGFPAVMKPISGAASLGVKKVQAEAELLACYREVITELRSLVVVSGALAQGNGSGQGIAAEKVVDLTVLLEQYLDGNEVDVDIVVSGGQWRYAAVTDNGPTVEPYFNETWAACPSLLPREQQVALKELAVQSVQALGFDAGVFHVECKYTSTGPQLIEVNARMGGGPVHEHNLRTWGVDLVEETLFIALGIPARPVVPPAPLEATAYFLVPAKSSGTVEEMPRLAELLQQDGVVWAKPLVKLGDRVVGPAEGLPTWLCDILVTRPSAKEALDFVWRCEAENQVLVK
mmetsp:Transcript_66798/g.201652  ORF Transcript_66798/g.201652 Transcript_66798/m.201652 type:complete len:591 (+) Transcript_66798:81-1853(+)